MDISNKASEDTMDMLVFDNDARPSSNTHCSESNVAKVLEHFSVASTTYYDRMTARTSCEESFGTLVQVGATNNLSSILRCTVHCNPFALCRQQPSQTRSPVAHPKPRLAENLSTIRRSSEQNKVLTARLQTQALLP